MPGSGIAGLSGNSVFFLENLKYDSPQWLNHFIFHNHVGGLSFCSSSQHLLFVEFLMILIRCEVTPHWIFGFKGGNSNQKYLSIYLYISWKEMPHVTSYP